MLYIDNKSIQLLQKEYPNLIDFSCQPKTWQTSRYIKVYINNHYDKDIHYEYRISNKWNGRVELHFEGDDWETKYSELIDYLMDNTQNSDVLEWSEWSNGFRCKHRNTINTTAELSQTMSYMTGLFNKLINNFTQKVPSFIEKTIDCNGTLGILNEKVSIVDKNLEDLLQLHLTIPNYQRIYCWEENNVKCLLDDVLGHIGSNKSVPYRLGTVILHSHDGKCDIIDGQQRLVTLALLLSEIGVKTSLLNEKFSSRLSIDYIAFNKHIIHEYVQRHLHIATEKLLKLLEFSVLVLKDTSLDLAYTFFSNQNSRGVALTDYDLLKAHHLRYIPLSLEQQSKHVVEVWNKMIEEGRIDKDQTKDQTAIPDYVQTLDTYIYRLRKWMRKKQCDDGINNYRIKREYEAAPFVDEIPSFGEKFYFYEPIQGGSHFFTYVEQHLNLFRIFNKTQEYTILHNTIQGSSNQWYRDITESVLFCYFLKFGTYYLSDALVVIMRILFQHRYVNSRAIKASVIQYAGDSELVLLIDQATSPTFFLAEARNIAKEMSYPSRQNMTPIMRLMRIRATNINKILMQNIVVESFKNLNR